MREIRSLRTRIVVSGIIALITASCIFLTNMLPDAKTGESREAYTPGNLIRLHIVANSNSRQDQHLKLEVRDAVLAKIETLFRGVASKEEAREVLDNNLARIKDVAEREVRRRGRDYPVKVMLGSFSFPARTYGALTVPAGEYEALRIVIGDGAGDNWWCILFPPLCLLDMENRSKLDRTKVGSSPEETLARLKLEFNHLGKGERTEILKRLYLSNFPKTRLGWIIKPLLLFYDFPGGNT